MNRIREKIKHLLIQFANMIGTKNFYDFGEEIVGLLNFEGHLYVATKKSLYKKTGKLWKPIKPTSEK